MSKWRTLTILMVTGQIQKMNHFQPIAVNSKHLYSHSTLSYRFSMKRNPFFKCFFLIVTVLLQTGCLNTTVVNLTPPKVPRNAAGSYRFEAAWETNQRSIKEDSIEGLRCLGWSPSSDEESSHRSWPLGGSHTLGPGGGRTQLSFQI